MSVSTTEYLKVSADVVVHVELNTVASVQHTSAEQHALMQEILELLRPHITDYVEKWQKMRKKDRMAAVSAGTRQKQKADNIIRGTTVKFLYEFLPVQIYQHVLLTRNLWKKNSTYKNYKIFPQKLVVFYQHIKPKLRELMGMKSSQAAVSSYFKMDDTTPKPSEESSKAVLSNIVSKSGPRLNKKGKKSSSAEHDPEPNPAAVNRPDPFRQMIESEAGDIKTQMSLVLTKDTLAMLRGITEEVLLAKPSPPQLSDQPGRSRHQCKLSSSRGASLEKPSTVTSDSEPTGSSIEARRSDMVSASCSLCQASIEPSLSVTSHSQILCSECQAKTTSVVSRDPGASVSQDIHSPCSDAVATTKIGTVKSQGANTRMNLSGAVPKAVDVFASKQDKSPARRSHRTSQHSESAEKPELCNRSLDQCSSLKKPPDSSSQERTVMVSPGIRMKTDGQKVWVDSSPLRPSATIAPGPEVTSDSELPDLQQEIQDDEWNDPDDLDDSKHIEPMDEDPCMVESPPAIDPHVDVGPHMDKELNMDNKPQEPEQDMPSLETQFEKPPSQSKRLKSKFENALKQLNFSDSDDDSDNKKCDDIFKKPALVANGAGAKGRKFHFKKLRSVSQCVRTEAATSCTKATAPSSHDAQDLQLPDIVPQKRNLCRSKWESDDSDDNFDMASTSQRKPKTKNDDADGLPTIKASKPKLRKLAARRKNFAIESENVAAWRQLRKEAYEENAASSDAAQDGNSSSSSERSCSKSLSSDDMSHTLSSEVNPKSSETDTQTSQDEKPLEIKTEPEDIFADCFIVDSFNETIVIEEEEEDRMWLEIASVTKVQYLTDEQLEFLVHKNIPYIKDIFKGKIYCERHEKYKKGGREQLLLRHNVPMGQFREKQHDVIMDILTQMFCKTTTKYFDYLFKVMLPELLIKICMDVQHLSHEDAQSTLDHVNQSQMIDF